MKLRRSSHHDVILNLLAHDYPDAIIQFFTGKTKPLAEIRTELDRREKKISAWLDELKTSN